MSSLDGAQDNGVPAAGVSAGPSADGQDPGGQVTGGQLADAQAAQAQAAAVATAAELGLVEGEAIREGDLLLRAEHIVKYFPIRRGVLFQREVGRVHAVDDVSLELRAGETLGLVGESGCGKSTLARCIARLYPLTSGKLVFENQDISRLSRRRLRPVRRELQVVFQDPYASLNPRKRVGAIISDPLRIHKRGNSKQIKQRVSELLKLVGLSPEHINRYPHEFSGGQRQRIGVARALALHPKLIIADEPVSALDVSIRAQVINLLDDLQDELRLTYIFIAHDLGVVRHVSDRIAVMYLGKIVEVSPAEELYQRPVHPYTEALLSAVPVPDPDLSLEREQIVLEGDVPSPISPPSGCRFHPRCRYATDICRQEEPPLVAYGLAGHMAACHHPLNSATPTISTAPGSANPIPN
jgi:oligopeptide transport system ATP-binding protein